MGAQREADISNFSNADQLALMRNLNQKDYRIIKNQNGCMVVETHECFYKIREVNKADPVSNFEQIVYETIAQEHRKMGLKWECFTVSECEKLFIVQRRQKLELLRDNKCAVRDAIKRSSIILRKVERALGFSQLVSQVNQVLNCDELVNIHLARAACPSLDDFAKKGDDFIMLGDSGFFLAMVNCNARWEYNSHQFVSRVSLECGDYYFAPRNIFEKTVHVAGTLMEPVSKWWLFPIEVGDLVGARNSYFSKLADMFSKNLKILATKQFLPAETAEDFKNYNMLTSSKSSLMGNCANDSHYLESTDEI